MSTWSIVRVCMQPVHVVYKATALYKHKLCVTLTFMAEMMPIWLS